MDDLDTIVVPAHEDGFQSVFLGGGCWYAVRIGAEMLKNLKYIAGYRTRPISAVTHVARIKSIEPYGAAGKYKRKYKLLFSEEGAQPITPIPFADSAPGSMQSPRYTSFARLSKAKRVADLFTSRR